MTKTVTLPTDLREGVTATQHALLDLIDMVAAENRDFETQLVQARACTSRALRATVLSAKVSAALEAAARMTDAADQMARLLAVVSSCEDRP